MNFGNTKINDNYLFSYRRYIDFISSCTDNNKGGQVRCATVVEGEDRQKSED